MEYAALATVYNRLAATGSNNETRDILAEAFAHTDADLLDLLVTRATCSEGRRSDWLGRLHLGAYSPDDDQLIEVGRLSTGYTDEEVDRGMLRPSEGCIAWNLGRSVRGTVRVLGLSHRLESEYRWLSTLSIDAVARDASHTPKTEKLDEDNL